MLFPSEFSARIFFSWEVVQLNGMNGNVKRNISLTAQDGKVTSGIRQPGVIVSIGFIL
jgi:hypothetical protein